MLLIYTLIVFTDKKHSRPIPALVRCEGRNRSTDISLSVRIAAGWRRVPRDREGNLAPWSAAGGGSLTRRRCHWRVRSAAAFVTSARSCIRRGAGAVCARHVV